MPRSRLLTSDDWPEAELRAAVLAGELVAVGPCWSSSAEPQTPRLRAAAAAWVLRDRRLIACTGTAAWIWGAVSRAPAPLDACIPPQVRVRVDADVHLREVTIVDDETVLLGGLRVTTPVRTAVDLLRLPNRAGVGFPPAAAAAVGGLLGVGVGVGGGVDAAAGHVVGASASASAGTGLGAVTAAEVAQALRTLGTIPMVRQAERRLAAVVAQAAVRTTMVSPTAVEAPTAVVEPTASAGPRLSRR